VLVATTVRTTVNTEVADVGLNVKARVEVVTVARAVELRSSRARASRFISITNQY
jgi:hypothetical protein